MVILSTVFYFEGQLFWRMIIHLVNHFEGKNFNG